MVLSPFPRLCGEDNTGLSESREITHQSSWHTVGAPITGVHALGELSGRSHTQSLLRGGGKKPNHDWETTLASGGLQSGRGERHHHVTTQPPIQGLQGSRKQEHAACGEKYVWAHKEELGFNGFGESRRVPQCPESDQCHGEAGHDGLRALCHVTKWL